MAHQQLAPFRQKMRFPDRMEYGRFNNRGEKSDRGNLFVGVGGEICHVWAVFKKPLLPGQFGIMDLEKVPGSYAVTGNVTSWMRGGAGYSPHVYNGGLLGSKAEFVKLEIGQWDVQVDVYLKPGEPPIRVDATERCTLSCDGFCVTEYVAENLSLIHI